MTQRTSTQLKNDYLEYDKQDWVDNLFDSIPVLDEAIQHDNTLHLGTSSAKVTIDDADTKFMQGYFDCGAASGDNRGFYLRLYLTGGGGGEALRVFTSVDSNVGTAHGAHISMNFDAAAGGSECSGLGAALRTTLHIPDIASWAPSGTYAAGMFEIYSDGSDSDPAGMTKLSVLRLVNSGTEAGCDNVDDDAFLMEIVGFDAGSDHVVGANESGGSTLDFSNWKRLKIDIDGETHYLVAAKTVANS